VFPKLHRCAELGRLHVRAGKVPFPDIPRFNEFQPAALLSDHGGGVMYSVSRPSTVVDDRAPGPHHEIHRLHS
jgi:hypothetical protein